MAESKIEGKLTSGEIIENIEGQVQSIMDVVDSVILGGLYETLGQHNFTREQAAVLTRWALILTESDLEFRKPAGEEQAGWDFDGPSAGQSVPISQEQLDTPFSQNQIGDKLKKLMQKNGLVMAFLDVMQERFVKETENVDFPERVMVINEILPQETAEWLREQVREAELPDWIPGFIDENKVEYEGRGYLARMDLEGVIGTKGSTVNVWLSQVTKRNKISGVRGKSLGLEGRREGLKKYYPMSDILKLLKLANKNKGLKEPKK
jgi:hypothetical protein